MDTSTLYPLQLVDVRLYDAIVERLEPSEAHEVDGEASTAAPLLQIRVQAIKRSKERACALLTVEIRGPEAANPLFHIKFTLEGLFESRLDLEELPEDVWQEFERVSAVTLLWPYAREYTQSFSRRMREDLPVLPTLNRLALQQVAANEKSSELEDAS